MSEQKTDGTGYNQISESDVQELITLLGEKYVLFRDREELEPYSHDEIPGTDYRAMPDVVVRPGTAEEISAIVKLANRRRIPITPRGAGSGLSGGAVPVCGGIVLGTDRLNRILDFDPANMMITVEPGVITNEINDYVKASGLFYAGYPMSLETCFIGGNVAENAGGGKAVKYGVTSRYVLGLEVVTPTGELVTLGGKLVKDVTGYNMVPLFVGSEGTLGIFTKIILKLVPRPRFQVDLLCLFPTGEAAIAAVAKLPTISGVQPTSIEYIDRLAFNEACRYLNESLTCGDCGAMLLVTLDGFDRDRLTEDYDAAGAFCQAAGATEVYVADSAATSERLWRLRRAIPEAFSLRYPTQSGEDVVVPPASIPRVIREFSAIAERYGICIPCYGHAGDGNVHARICAGPEWDHATWKQQLPVILRELYAVVRDCGGRISGEHGIGHKRIHYMSCVVSEEYLDLLRTIKQALDPNGIMNPGKVIPPRNGDAR
ncbi:MAG: FAD-binding oxidoreductase [Planctomycetia bacterium]|nr:FAD-binding oxidoreductase [Planctomycetia bacterium]